MVIFKFPKSKRVIPFGVLDNESDESKELDEFDDIDDIDEIDESLSVYEAAEIWASHGKDEDYMFGYTEEELEGAL